jgi:hypothetical protein
LSLGSFWHPAGAVAPLDKGKSKAGLDIGYIRKDTPVFEIPPCRGARYPDSVPDTLDIAERAELGIHALTSVTDPRADYEIYFGVSVLRNPPVMAHDFSDWCQNVESMMEALPLLRLATGSSLNSEVDPVWMKTLLKSIGPDGLVYLPLRGRPWSRLNPAWVQPVWRANGAATDVRDESVTQLTVPCLWPRAIGAMTIYYLRDQNPLWKETIERMISRISDLATRGRDYAFVPAGGLEPNAKIGGGKGVIGDGVEIMPTGALAVSHGNGILIEGLAHYYKATGYEPARELAAEFANFLKYHSQYYSPDARFVLSPMERNTLRFLKRLNPDLNIEGLQQLSLGGHFHNHTLGLLSLLEYATAVRDREMMEFVKSGFEWARTQGSSLVGFFPELIIPDYPSCETCEVADMISIALKLTVAGVDEYWDDVDRWVRNQFAENQLTDTSWIYGLAESMPKKPVAFNETDEHVPERCLGVFTGAARGNEWGPGSPQCCTGNAARTLWNVWHHIVEYRDERLRVNLLLNRASTWADVHSYIPCQGRVDLKMKKRCDSVWVRAPEWVESHSARVLCRANNASRQVNWQGRFVSLGRGEPGDTITLTFPIEERVVKEKLGNVVYTLTLRGTTVVSVDPPGKNGPLYERPQYRESEVRWRKVERFVPGEDINW